MWTALGRGTTAHLGATKAQLCGSRALGEYLDQSNGAKQRDSEVNRSPGLHAPPITSRPRPCRPTSNILGSRYGCLHHPCHPRTQSPHLLLQNLTPPVLNTEPRSLATTTKGPVQAQEEDLTKSIGNSSWLRRLLRFLGYYSSEALTIRGATGLYNAVCDQTDTNALHDSMELPPSFYSRWCGTIAHSTLAMCKPKRPCTLLLCCYQAWHLSSGMSFCMLRERRGPGRTRPADLCRPLARAAQHTPGTHGIPHRSYIQLDHAA